MEEKLRFVGLAGTRKFTVTELPALRENEKAGSAREPGRGRVR